MNGTRKLEGNANLYRWQDPTRTAPRGASTFRVPNAQEKTIRQRRNRNKVRDTILTFVMVATAVLLLSMVIGKFGAYIRLRDSVTLAEGELIGAMQNEQNAQQYLQSVMKTDEIIKRAGIELNMIPREKAEKKYLFNVPVLTDDVTRTAEAIVGSR